MKLDCWERPDIVEFDARVVWVEQAGARVELDRSMFFPDAGGQEGDRGHLRFGRRTYRVSFVKKAGDRALLSLDPPPGPEVVEGAPARCSVDADRRVALGRSHTAQHLLSAKLLDVAGVHTTRVDVKPGGFALKLDAAVEPAALERALADLLAATCVPAASLPVKCEVLQRGAALEKYEGRLRGHLPPGPWIRVVSVEGWDAVPCGGTHVASTADVGPVFVDSFRGGREVRATVGPAAAARVAGANAAFLSVAASLNQWKSPGELAKLVERRLLEARSRATRARELGARLLAEVAASGGAPVGPPGTRISLRVVVAPVDPEAAGDAARALPPESVLVACSESGDALACSSSRRVPANALVTRLVELFGGKGGGSANLARARLDGPPPAGDVRAACRRVVEDFLANAPDAAGGRRSQPLS
ncbi:MAG: hypothetical protein Kow0069_07690 [Promethearchaeota archaeon]